MLHIIDCTSAKEMWEKLTCATKLVLRDKEKSDDMATHIFKLEDLAHRLRMIGETILDSMIITKILMILPVNYNHFINAFYCLHQWESTP